MPVSGYSSQAHPPGCTCSMCATSAAHGPGCPCANCAACGYAASSKGLHEFGCGCPMCSPLAGDDRDVTITLNFDSQNISDSQNADNASEVVVKQRPQSESPAVPARSETPHSGRGVAAVQLRTAMFPYKDGEISREEAGDRLRELGVRSDDIEPTLNRLDDYAYGKPLTVPNRVLDSIARHQGTDGEGDDRRKGGQADSGHNKRIVVNEGGQDKPQKTLSAAMRARASGEGEARGRSRSSGSGSTKRSPRGTRGPKQARSHTKPKKTRGSRRKGKGRMARSMLGG